MSGVALIGLSRLLALNRMNAEVNPNALDTLKKFPVGASLRASAVCQVHAAPAMSGSWCETQGHLAAKPGAKTAGQQFQPHTVRAWLKVVPGTAHMTSCWAVIVARASGIATTGCPQMHFACHQRKVANRPGNPSVVRSFSLHFGTGQGAQGRPA
jgi:hypothetical protein